MSEPFYEDITDISVRDREAWWRENAIDLGQRCYVQMLDGKKSALFAHPKGNGAGEMCWGHVPLAGPKAWNVLSWEPLTLEPSIRCITCSCHGFIRQGKWVPA